MVPPYIYGRTTVKKHIWENILENEGHAGVYWKVTLVVYKKKTADIFSQHLKARLNGFNIWFNMRSGRLNRSLNIIESVKNVENVLNQI